MCLPFAASSVALPLTFVNSVELNLHIYITRRFKHCKKRLAVSPSPAGMSLTYCHWPGIIILFPDIPAGDGKTANLFFTVNREEKITVHVLILSYFSRSE